MYCIVLYAKYLKHNIPCSLAHTKCTTHSCLCVVYYAYKSMQCICKYLKLGHQFWTEFRTRFVLKLWTNILDYNFGLVSWTTILD